MCLACVVPQTVFSCRVVWGAGKGALPGGPLMYMDLHCFALILAKFGLLHYLLSLCEFGLVYIDFQFLLYDLYEFEY